jgi:hypothetical protein
MSQPEYQVAGLAVPARRHRLLFAENYLRDPKGEPLFSDSSSPGQQEDLWQPIFPDCPEDLILGRPMAGQGVQSHGPKLREGACQWKALNGKGIFNNDLDVILALENAAIWPRIFGFSV